MTGAALFLKLRSDVGVPTAFAVHDPFNLGTAINHAVFDTLGNAYLFGTINSPRTRGDMGVIRINNNGALAWFNTERELGEFHERADVGFVDAEQNVLMVGAIPGATESDLHTVWYQQANFTPSPAGVVGGQGGNLELALNSAAPVLGYTFGLLENSDAVSLPEKFDVDPLSTSKLIPFTTSPVAADTEVEIRAQNEDVTLSLRLRVLAPRPLSLTLASSTIVGGASTTATLKMTGRAPEAGVQVTVSDNSGFIHTPGAIAIGFEQDTEQFIVGSSPVSANATRLIFATANGVTRQAAMTLTPAALSSLTLNPAAVVGGSSTTGTVALNGLTGPNSVSVALSDNSSAITTPTSVVIPSGAGSASFTVTSTRVTAAATRTVTATLNGVTRNASLTLNPTPTLMSVRLAPSTVVGGDSVLGTVALNTAAPTGGVAVALSDNSGAIATPSGVLVPAGEASATFLVSTQTVSATATRQVSASFDGVTRTSSLTLTP